MRAPKEHKVKTSRPMVVALMTIWTVIIVTSLVWNLSEIKHWVVETARTQADMAYEKNILYRRWNTEHGGVYVEVTENLRPNPYLKDIPERDITTPSGKMLTLINPALMMREVSELAKAEHGITERLVSRTPINPYNLPDEWEAASLRGFDTVHNAVSAIVEVDGEEHMRLIRPLFAEKSCMRCHAEQGYEVGEVQGAISIALPMAPFRATARRHSSTLVAAHVLLWFLGSSAIILVALRLRKAELDRMRMANELVKAQKLESLGILAGGIAHDYNNLLTSIMANISLATQMEDDTMRAYKEKPDGIVLESLLDAEKATQRAKDLTKQLITYSKGGTPVKEIVPDAGALIRESVDFALRGSNVNCEFSISDDLFSAEVDKGQLDQVLQNLVINAVQAMPEGGWIGVKAENHPADAKHPPHLEPGTYLKIAVKDQGTGIPKEHLAKIFDPYFSTKKSGTGLGLATAYSLIRSHGGNLVVDSEAGVGTTFTIYLPGFEKKETVVKPVPGSVAAAPEGVQGAWESAGRILVMDDDDLVRNAVHHILTSAGYEVDQSRDGNEAIDLFTEARSAGRPYDLVILDLTVSGELGGGETVKALLEIDPETRAIVSSGYFEDPIMQDYEKYGFKGVVVKPYNRDDLTRVVREVLSADSCKSPSAPES